MGQGNVDDQEPKEGEKDHGIEFHPLRRGTENQEGDDRKGQLKDAEDTLRDPEGLVCVGSHTHAAQEEKIRPPQEGTQGMG